MLTSYFISSENRSTLEIDEVSSPDVSLLLCMKSKRLVFVAWLVMRSSARASFWREPLVTHGKGANFVSLKSHFCFITCCFYRDVVVWNPCREAFDLHSCLWDLSGSRPLDEKTILRPSLLESATERSGRKDDIHILILVILYKPQSELKCCQMIQCSVKATFNFNLKISL